MERTAGASDWLSGETLTRRAVVARDWLAGGKEEALNRPGFAGGSSS